MTSLPTAPAPGSPARGPVVGLRRRRLRAWAITGAVLFGFVLAALVVTAYLRAAFGVQALLLGTLVALLPLTVVIPTFVWLDRLEAEPTRYLLAAFAWGALVAVIIAGTLNTSAILVLRQSVSADGATVVTAVLVAPFVEEAAKGMGVLLFWWLARREFDGLVDGMVYAGVVAAGFAFTENIQYFAISLIEGGAEQASATFFVRGILSPFAHVMFTSVTGYALGLAARRGASASAALRTGLVGFVGAVALHAFWNGSAVFGDFFGLYLSVQVPLFIAFIAGVLLLRGEEARITSARLGDYAAAGWFTREEVQMLATPPGRRAALAWARTLPGNRVPIMKAFIRDATRLAAARQRAITGRDPGAADAERELLARTAHARAALFAR